jgi:hypothetical protein
MNLGLVLIKKLQIPDEALEHRPRRETVQDGESSSSSQSRPSGDTESENQIRGQQNGRPAPQ